MPTEENVYFDTVHLIEGRTAKLIYKGALVAGETPANGAYENSTTISNTTGYGEANATPSNASAAIAYGNAAEASQMAAGAPAPTEASQMMAGAPAPTEASQMMAGAPAPAEASPMTAESPMAAGNPEPEIYVHYGFGLLWENLQETKLTKVANGVYEANITMNGAESINFCFRDSNNNWDNNSAQNYTMPIGKEEVTIAKVEPTSIEVPRLKRSYIIAKKIRIGFYKIITFLPKLFSGDLKKKVKE